MNDKGIFPLKYRIILASTSPRRREILKTLGFEFIVKSPSVIEKIKRGETPHGFAKRMAVEKALSIKCHKKAQLIIAADTIVVLGKKIIGKPKDKADAKKILKQLSGKFHEVLTGIAILNCRDSSVITEVVKTRVKFIKLSDLTIDSYIKSGEPMDKAGAYAVQGLASAFVERVEGCYTNVIGFPVPTFLKMISKMQRC